MRGKLGNESNKVLYFVILICTCHITYRLNVGANIHIIFENCKEITKKCEFSLIIDDSPSPRLRLEASTKAHCSLLTTHHSLWYWLPASGEGLVATRRQMLSHFPTVTQSTGFQPEPLLTTHCHRQRYRFQKCCLCFTCFIPSET